jgi:hypothetical protein
MAKITNTGVFIVEGSDDATDVAGSSQLWVKSDAPSSLYHTDDTGTKFRINGTTVTSELAASGTTMTISGIPAGVTRVDVLMQVLSTNGTGEWMMRIGDSGGIETSGYTSKACNAAGSMESDSTAYKLTYEVAAGDTRDGILQLRLSDATNNTWISSGVHSDNGSTSINTSAGAKSLSGALTQIQLLNSAGNTWDAGTIALQYS